MLHGYVNTSVIVHFEHIHTILVKLIARYNFFYYLSHNFFLSNFYLLNLVFDASSHRIILKTVLLRPKAIFAKQQCKVTAKDCARKQFNEKLVFLCHIFDAYQPS